MSTPGKNSELVIIGAPRLSFITNLLKTKESVKLLGAQSIKERLMELKAHQDLSSK